MVKQQPLVSIVICLHAIGDRFFSDLKKFRNLTYKNIEIIIVTNNPTKFSLDDKKIRIIVPSKPHLSLSEKRDIGYKKAKGTYVAYIDDDAYPSKDWITHAVNILEKNQNIGVLGGPNITPPDESYWSKIGGKIFESYLTSGGMQWRFVPTKRMDVGELQGVNLIFPKHVLLKLGGFKSKLYSGDDSKVCSDVRKIGLRVLYDPSVIVYHHRRAFPFDHLKQVRNMGFHRGFFVKAHPETLTPIYFIPCILTIGLIAGGITSLFIPLIRMLFGIIFLFFYILAYASSVRYAGYMSSFVVAFGIILTHMTYGIFFIRGMCTSNIHGEYVGGQKG